MAYIKQTFSKSFVTVVTKGSDVNKAKVWMGKQVAEGKQYGTKSDWLVATRDEIAPNLSKRQFDIEVWPHCATEEMKRAGPKNK